MKIENIAVHFIAAFLAFGINEAAAQDTNMPCIWPSILNPRAGIDHVYLNGAHLAPGQQVFIVTPDFGGNGGSFFADTNGGFHLDITDSPCVTATETYIRSYSLWTKQGDASTNFSVTYAPEKVESPKSVITHIDILAGPINPGYDFNYRYVRATLSVGNMYHLEYTTNLAAGPWIPIFSQQKKIWSSSCTNVLFDPFLTNDNSQFFRIVSE